MQLSLPKSPATNPSLRPDHHDTSLARRFGPVAALLAFCKSLDVGRLSSFALTHTPFPRFNRAGPENAAHCRGSGPAGRFVRLPTTSRPLLQRSERPSFSHALPCPRTASSSRRDRERTSEMRFNLRGHPCQPVSPRPRSPRSALARRTRAHWVVAECTSASVVVLPTPPGLPETRCLLSSLSPLLHETGPPVQAPSHPSLQASTAACETECDYLESGFHRATDRGERMRGVSI
jgi:hypothetical protein